MEYTLLIDYREHNLKKYFEELDFSKDKNLKNVQLKIENLDLGDIIIKKGNKIILIIERKSLQDLYSSINDGRYKEQKFRLMNNFEDNQIVYMIEDCDVKYIKQKFKNFDSIINGAIINCIFRDNIKIIKTKNINESIIYIKTLLKKVQNNLDFFVKTKLNEKCKEEKVNDENLKIIEIKTNSNSYVENVKIKKKDNINPKNCNIIMLCQIPGVSTKISKLILEEYKSISNLIINYNKINLLENKEILLRDLTYSINNDKKRKIGPVLSKRIYEYFF